MAKKNNINSSYSDVMQHYTIGFQETDSRRTGRGRIGSISFDEADELFRSWLDEGKWPYDALLFDPRVFTFLFEKTARLLGSKLRGEMVPREGGDALRAKVNNAILDYQWDQANRGGSMLQKWSLMDLATRKYGAAFGLCKWRYEEDRDGKAVFDGPEMSVVNNRDCAHDASGNSVETLNWFQIREYVTGQDLKRVNDAARSKPIYQNLDQLFDSVQNEIAKSDTRDTNWMSRNRAISGLTQQVYGDDPVFKHIEIVTEYRRDEWITFAPRHNIVLRKIDNPYKNYEIPVVMLRYFAIDDDLYGISEIEPVKSLQKAINALLCQYVDEINQRLYSPIAIGPGVRQSTLEWGKGARWQMNNPMTDFRIVESQSNAAGYFNNTYSALVAAMMNAIGETSLGVSNIDRYQNDKTATEIKHLVSQRNARDNYNQMFLAEAIERQMKLWHSMNQTMLFADPKKQYFILRVAGKDAIDYFKASNLDGQTLPSAAADFLGQEENKDENPDNFLVPQYPVEVPNTNGEAGNKLVPKFSYDKNTRSGQLYVQASDLLGNYDFIADVKSMSMSASDDEKAARDRAVTAILSNPNTLMILQQQGIQPKFKDLFVSWLEDAGFKDADRYFEAIPPGQAASGQPPGAPPQPGQGGQGAPPPPSPEITPPQQFGGEATQQIPSNFNPAEFAHFINKAVVKRGGVVGPPGAQVPAV